MEFNVTMIRKYETLLVVDAESEAEAIEKAQSLSGRYDVELEQCCVTEEDYIIE
jgi:hypothetical protein